MDEQIEPIEDKPGLLIEVLALLPAKAMLDQERLANILGVTKRTIRRMVGRYELPPPVRLAGRSVWFAGRVLEHIEASVERAASKAERQASKFRHISP